MSHDRARQRIAGNIREAVTRSLDDDVAEIAADEWRSFLGQSVADQVKRCRADPVFAKALRETVRDMLVPVIQEIMRDNLDRAKASMRQVFEEGFEEVCASQARAMLEDELSKLRQRITGNLK